MGAARRLPARHRRGLPGARLPGRVRQRLALQRDQRPGHPADPDHRRRRPDRRRDGQRLHRLQARGRGDRAHRRDRGLARPVDLPRARSAAARKARRRRSISPPRSATATSCASSSAPGRSTTVHDCSDGGLALALAEMAMAGGIGADVTGAAGGLPAPRLPVRRGPGPLRARRAMPDAAADILYEAGAVGVPAVVAGLTGGDSLILPGEQAISRDALKAAHEAWLPDLHGRQSR